MKVIARTCTGMWNRLSYVLQVLLMGLNTIGSTAGKEGQACQHGLPQHAGCLRICWNDQAVDTVLHISKHLSKWYAMFALCFCACQLAEKGVQLNDTKAGAIIF